MGKQLRNLENRLKPEVVSGLRRKKKNFGTAFRGLLPLGQYDPVNRMIGMGNPDQMHPVVRIG
jgi:hypothetical protein